MVRVVSGDVVGWLWCLVCEVCEGLPGNVCGVCGTGRLARILQANCKGVHYGGHTIEVL